MHLLMAQPHTSWNATGWCPLLTPTAAIAIPNARAEPDQGPIWWGEVVHQGVHVRAATQARRRARSSRPWARGAAPPPLRVIRPPRDGHLVPFLLATSGPRRRRPPTRRSPQVSVHLPYAGAPAWPSRAPAPPPCSPHALQMRRRPCTSRHCFPAVSRGRGGLQEWGKKQGYES